MKCNKLVMIFACALFSGQVMAQEVACPHKVSDVVLKDLRGNDATLPMWGEKNLLIFYVDPDKHSQNKAFTEEMEANHRASGDGIYGFGVLNLKDTGLADGLIRYFARKRTEKNGATVLSDSNHILRDAWGLGDCNNCFVLMIVSKEGELVYMKKGELNKAEQEEFYQIVDKYRH